MSSNPGDDDVASVVDGDADGRIMRAPTQDDDPTSPSAPTASEPDVETSADATEVSYRTQMDDPD